jgi:hypothetical protein
MIDKIILIPKKTEILESGVAGFTPPQAFLDGTKSKYPIWRIYNPLNNHPKDKDLHTFGLIFAWDKKPIYPSLDYFFRLHSDSPFEWGITWNSEDRNLKDIVFKIRTLGMKPDSYGELIILNSFYQELYWPTLKVKDGEF